MALDLFLHPVSSDCMKARTAFENDTPFETGPIDEGRPGRRSVPLGAPESRD